MSMTQYDQGGSTDFGEDGVCCCLLAEQADKYWGKAASGLLDHG